MKRLPLLALFFFIAGCQYYRVTDPGSGRTYYTHDMIAARYTYNGAVQFRDLKSGADVTLQSSEVKAISEAEAKTALAAP